MSGIQGRHVAGLIASLYFVAAKIDTKDEATVAAAAIANNQVIDVADMGALNKTRAVIDIPIYGSDFQSKITGTASADSFTFNVTYNNDNAVHTAIRDDDGKSEHTYIIKFESGNNATFAVFDGYIETADVTPPLDDRLQMDVSIARTGGVTWVDKA